MGESIESDAGKGSLARVALPPVARSSRHTKRLVMAFRRQVEAELIASAGEITALGAKRVRTACKAMLRAMEVDRLLARAGLPGEPDSKLTHEQWQGYADRSIRYEEAADKALASLGLETRRVKDVWDAIYRQPLPPVLDDAGDSSAGLDAGSDADGQGEQP